MHEFSLLTKLIYAKLNSTKFNKNTNLIQTKLKLIYLDLIQIHILKL